MMSYLGAFIGIILSKFGYARVPLAAVILASWIKSESEKEQPDIKRIKKAAATLEELFRSARKCNP